MWDRHTAAAGFRLAGRPLEGRGRYVSAYRGVDDAQFDPKVLRIAAMKGEDMAAVGHYGYTEPTARVYITVVRTENRVKIRFLPDSGQRVELTLLDNDRLVGHLHRGSVANPMKLLRVRSTNH